MQVELVALGHAFARMPDAAAGAEPGDGHEALHAGGEGDERAERHELDDLAGDVAAGAKRSREIVPRIRHRVPQAEGEAVVVPVEGLDRHADLLALVDDVLRLDRAVPRQLAQGDEPLGPSYLPQ